MFVFVLIIAVISLFGIKRRKDSETILSQEDTLMINGIFILLVFLSHCSQYLTLSDTFLNDCYEKFRNIHGQWIVTTFLAFSGYGVMRQLCLRGESYIKNFPQKRIAKVFWNFDLAVVLYLIVSFVIEQPYDIKTIILSFIGWTSVGNSNWYVFAILLMYIITYVIIRIFREDYFKVAFGVTIGCIIYILIMSIVGQPSWFYSTALCYPLGVWIALYREKIIQTLSNRRILSFIILAVVFLVTYKLRHNAYVMNINSVVFVLLIVWLMVKFQIGNAFLRFLGRHIFSLFILQRLPMIIIEHYNFFGTENYVAFILVSFVITIALALMFDKVIDLIAKGFGKIHMAKTEL